MPSANAPRSTSPATSSTPRSTPPPTTSPPPPRSPLPLRKPWIWSAFGFHPALKVTKITDDTGKLLTGERSADGTIRVTPAAPFTKGQVNHWTFEYEGVITGSEDGPVEGLKLAAIQEPITYLLYPARWFPIHRLPH